MQWESIGFSKSYKCYRYAISFVVSECNALGWFAYVQTQASSLLLAVSAGFLYATDRYESSIISSLGLQAQDCDIPSVNSVSKLKPVSLLLLTVFSDNRGPALRLHASHTSHGCHEVCRIHAAAVWSCFVWDCCVALHRPCQCSNWPCFACANPRRKAFKRRLHGM